MSTHDKHLDPEIDALPRKQGAVSEHEYLQLTDFSKRLVEFVDGMIEAPSMPTTQHQAISRYLLHAFEAVVTPMGGEVFYAPLRVRCVSVGIAEYWIVDPQPEIITVLRLAGASYVEHGVFGQGALARSALFPDLAVDVDAVFAAGRRGADRRAGA